MKLTHDYYLTLTLCCVSLGMAALASSVASGDALPPFPHHIEVTATVQSQVIVTFQPVIARVTLTNRDVVPFELDVRDDGAPYALTCWIAYGEGEYFKDNQWIRRSGPAKHSVILAPGESTSGDILILFGLPTGFAFSDPGTYLVAFAFRPDSRFAPIFTNTLKVKVLPDELENRRFLEELGQVAFKYYGLDPKVMRAAYGQQFDEYLVAIKLIHEILKTQQPHLIDPEGDAYNRKQAALVETLGTMLERFPRTLYAGYIARFLGLVHIKTFEHVVSYARIKRWSQKNLTPEQQAARDRAAIAREKALRYLTMASQHDLWPRTTATVQLARLYTMSEQWDKAREAVEQLRTMDEAANGAAVATTVEQEIRRYREKLERLAGREAGPRP